MSHLTNIDGVPDRLKVKAGMAYFDGTGPAGKTCVDCGWRGYKRQAESGTWNDFKQEYVFKWYSTSSCLMFKQLTGKHGPAVRADWAACKYFKPKLTT